MAKLPLISVIMPTYDRPEFVARAVKIFNSYTYKRTELIIVDDSPTPSYLGRFGNVRYVRLNERTNLGVKHNLAASLAQGDVICCQDDDDLFQPMRLTRQVEPIVMDQADLTGYRIHDILRFPDLKCYRFREGVKIKPSPRTTQIYLPKFHDSTAMFHRKVWDAGLQFTLVPVFQKGDFLNDAIRAGFRSQALANESGEFVYARHKNNTWQFNSNLLAEIAMPFYLRALLTRYGVGDA